MAIDGKAVRRGKRRGGKTPYIVTIDAAGCQKNILRQIVVDCRADAVLALKDNQRTLHDEMLLLFEKERGASPHLFAKYEAPVEKNSGRVERRTCWQTGHVGWFADIDEWQGLRSVIMVEAERSVRNAETGEWETSTESRLYISSLKVDPELALEATRSHWGVESMHWTLDVTFGEDYCRARTKHAAANRASVRRMAASLAIPWARRHKCTVKEAMMSANQSREARLEMPVVAHCRRSQPPAFSTGAGAGLPTVDSLHTCTFAQ